MKHNRLYSIESGIAEGRTDKIPVMVGTCERNRDVTKNTNLTIH